jgi:hypothetical protein
MAHDLGWHATFHHDWSWDEPGKTGVVLFQQKTPVVERLRSWENSFRKWVIERAEVLKHERLAYPVDLASAVANIVKDATFPMQVRSPLELHRNYLRPFHMADSYGDFLWKESYEFLFDKWLRSADVTTNATVTKAEGALQIR